MKLLYFPMLIYGLIQSRYFRDRKDFWCVKLIGMVVGLTAIPVLFYTYNGAFGKSPDWINIAIFFIAAAIVYLLENHLYNIRSIRCGRPTLAFVTMCLIGMCFIVFTFAPPHIPLFKDPLSGAYGIQ